MARRKSTNQTAAQPTDRQIVAVLSVLIVVATLIAYSGVFGHDFLGYDDPQYVTENPYVRTGLSWTGIKGAFTQIVASNWQPVTVLSHELDVTLFGANPVGHHATNIVLHCANAVLLLLVLRAMTGEVRKSAFVAALFALHPLHVESVAWVAERKDVLSTFFLFLTLLAYVRYAGNRTVANYTLVALLFALGLMAKSMLVTLPPLLLVLDYWPLKRVDFARPEWRGESVALVREKLPLIALTVIFSVIAVITQRAGGALQDVQAVALPNRVINAIVSYAEYALRVFYPSPLAIFYPYPGAQALWKIALALVLLFAVTAVALRLRHSRPYLLAGWLWYLGTLVPVIGIVQIGAQAMADRYTYITTIGIFIMLTWGLAPILTAKVPRALTGICISVLILLSGITVSYARKWTDTETVFRHALSVTTDNYPAHVNLGLALANKGDLTEATANFEAATRIEPRAAEAWFNLGSAYLFQNDYPRAAEAYAKVVEIAPNDADAHVRLGESLYKAGKANDAVAEFKKALEINPKHPDANAYLQAIAQHNRGSQE